MKQSVISEKIHQVMLNFCTLLQVDFEVAPQNNLPGRSSQISKTIVQEIKKLFTIPEGEQ